jgi:hypothetical protein
MIQGKIKAKLSILPILVISIMTATCQKKAVVPVSAPSPPPQPMTRPLPPPLPVPSTWPELPLPPSRLPSPPEPPLPRNFREGEASFRSGDYAEAIRSYEQYLRSDPVTQYKDVVMFKLGLAYALTCSVAECRKKSTDQFKSLVSQFPESPYSAEAQFIISLQTDLAKLRQDAKESDEKIKKLTEELDRLKAIDLERQPTRKKKK